MRSLSDCPGAAPFLVALVLFFFSSFGFKERQWIFPRTHSPPLFIKGTGSPDFFFFVRPNDVKPFRRKKLRPRMVEFPVGKMPGGVLPPLLWVVIGQLCCPPETSPRLALDSVGVEGVFPKQGEGPSLFSVGSAFLPLHRPPLFPFFWFLFIRS